MQEQFPFTFFALPPFYYFVLPPTQLQNVSQFQKSQKVQETTKKTKFMKLFEKQIEQRNCSSYVKEWTKDQDNLLIQFGENCSNWKQFSKRFAGKTAKVCHRRYRKLKIKQEKWPKEDDFMIKQLREVEKKSWIEIQTCLKKYKAKKIRERYKNYLEIEVNRKKWTVQEDLQLWTKVEQNGKSWKQISFFFPHRSGLQLRNRYYKFLQPISQRIRYEIEETN